MSQVPQFDSEVLRRIFMAQQQPQAQVPPLGGATEVPTTPAAARATAPVTGAIPTVASPSIWERISTAFQAPQQQPGGRDLTSWEKWGTSDTGLGLSAILGTLAQAVDPQGMGGRAGGAMSSMAKGEMASRNIADRTFQQQQMNKQMLEIYKALLGSQTGGTPAR